MSVTGTLGHRRPKPVARRAASTDAHVGQDILWLKNYLPYRMAIIAAGMLRESGRVYKRDPHPLTTPQWRILAILANFQPLVASEISKISMLSKVAVSRALAQLARRGFVTRKRTRQDQRALEVMLTAQGWHYYGKLIPLMRRQEQVLRAVLRPSELKVLFSMLDQFDAFFSALEERRRLYGDAAEIEGNAPAQAGNGASGGI
jgi:DNA-binding MarR family transcriptional regulator